MTRGSVRWYPQDRCPKCNGKFKSVIANGAQVYISCPECLIPPRRFRLDARGFGDRSGNRIGMLSRDRSGIELTSFEHAKTVMSALREEARNDEGFVDVSRWNPSAMREVTVQSEGDKWITEVYRERSKNYATNVEGRLKNHIYPVFGTMDVRDIKPRHLHNFRESLYAKGFEPNTIKSIMNTLRILLGNLVKLDVIPKVPWSEPVKIKKDTRPYVERHEQQEILDHVEGPMDVKLLFRVEIETGSRPGEVCALKVNSLRGNGEIEMRESINNYGKVGPTKTGDIFNRFVSEELYALLERHAAGRFGEEFLFRKEKGSPYRPCETSTIWRDAGIAAGRQIPLNHSMRHSRISQEINEVLKEEYREKVRGVLGHRSVAMSMKYVRPKASMEGE